MSIKHVIRSKYEFSSKYKKQSGLQKLLSYENQILSFASDQQPQIGPAQKQSSKGVRLPQACNFIKKETLAQVFFCTFCKSFKNTFFTEHLRTTPFLYLQNTSHGCFCHLSSVNQWKMVTDSSNYRGSNNEDEVRYK